MTRTATLFTLSGLAAALLAAPQPAPAQAAPPDRPATVQNTQNAPQAAPSAQPTGPDLQVMLDRAGFSPGVVDGRPGSNTKKALAAFQAAHDLPVTGALDPVTWRNLQAAAGGQPTAAEYTVTPEDLDGPFVREIPEDMVEKSKLETLAYTSPLELLAERFHTTPEYLRQLNPRAAFSTAGEKLRVPNVRPWSASRAGEPGTNGKGEEAQADTRVVVSKSDSTLTVERGDDVLFFAPVSAGSEHDPLPIGDWKVKSISKNPTFNYNPDLFWDADPEHSKAKIPPGPNNPVGVVWIDLSKEHYGIHGTPEPRTIGKTLSHGCVRLTNWDAATLASLVRPGTPVLFRP